VERLAERVRALPGMHVLLPALDGLPPAYLVGGAVRDLLRGERAVDLDVAFEGDAPAAARKVAERIGGTATVHDRFGTATVKAPGLAVDLATTRRERYERPGALPDVSPATLGEDLARRDFAINAMAVALSGLEVGRLIDPHGGREDLDAGVVRILHDESFVDDPTRLLRAVRYESRLGYRMDRDTEATAREAIAAGSLDTVSGHRVGDELIDLLGEVEVGRAMQRMADLGLDRALHPSLDADPELVASAALACGECGADRALAALAALLVERDPEALAAGAGALLPGPGSAAEWLDGLGLGRSDRERVLAAARQAPGLMGPLRADLPHSAVHALLRCEPPETLALALAIGAPAGPVLRFLANLRSVHLDITGDDLIEAGVPRGPAIGRALDEVLRMKLDGELSGREAELAAALRIAGDG
jgi:tRNA nucleotidyltransferase (CCA-adding enzyme)